MRKVIAVAFGVIFVAKLATWNTPDEIPCVPSEAVNYNGTTNSWESASGEILLYSPEEDTYDWCK